MTIVMTLMHDLRLQGKVNGLFQFLLFTCAQNRPQTRHIRNIIELVKTINRVCSVLMILSYLTCITI